MGKKFFIIFSIVFVLFGFKLMDENKITVYLIGDSTVSIKEKRNYPETGWGMPFTQFFNENVKIDNRAMNGRSTSSFLQENRWKPVVSTLKKGDYVLIQFGHNDEGKGERYKDRSTTPDEFKLNLMKYIDETKAKSAIPVLITPVSRRYFDKEGNVRQTHESYSDVVRELANSQQIK